MPYIMELCKMSGVEEIVVVSPVGDLDERKDMGWENDNANEIDAAYNLKIDISPRNNEVEELLELFNDGETWCLFSGINAFPEVSEWFRISLKYNVMRGIITEPPYLYEHPLWQHAVRFVLKDWRYTKYIDKVFVMGDEYVWYYKMWSKRWDVIPFMYCTKWVERTKEVPHSDKLNILYVGSLSHRKNVQELLCAVECLPTEIQKLVHVGIVGDGEKREDLKSIVKRCDYSAETTFYGSISMSSIPEIMQEYDVLVLPSLHDGWGAVVNEALTLGLYVICSDKCGAKYLLKENTNGSVYKSGDVESLSEMLKLQLSDMNDLRQNMNKRVSWSKENISGKAVAKYMFDNLEL